MKKSYIIGIIFSLAILVLGVYFFTRTNIGDDLINQKNKLQSDIVLAENKLNKEKETLNTMTNNLESSFSLGASVQDQMRKASGLVGQTDFMFTNPLGVNPELIVKNFLTSARINSERKNINLLISAWQKETDISSITKIDIKESEKIKADAQTIKTFIEDLSQTVGSFTVANSGLSQLQINTYLSQLPSVDSINQVLASLQVAIDSSSNISSNPAVTPTVMPENVITQQSVVAQAQTEVVVLQEQLATVEEQIQQTSPAPTPVPSDTNTTANPDSQNQTGSQSTNNPPYIPDNTNHQDIIVQPGPPRLIQGTNQY